MDEKDNSRSSLQTAADLGRAAKAAYRIAQAAAVSGVHGAAAAAVKETVPALVKFLLVVLLIMIVIPMVLKEFKYLRVRQLHAMVRTHYRAQGIEIDARRMEIMLRQMRTGTNYVWLRGDVVSYGDRRIDPRLLEALDVMLELTKAQPGFYSKDGLHEPFLLRFTGNGKGAGYLFSVAWLDAATHIATVPRMKGERIIWISESNSFGEINLPRHHFFAVRQEDGTHRFFGSNEPGKI